MSKRLTRRELVKRLGAAAAIGSLTADAAQHVHQITGAGTATGPYKPKFFQPHEYKTLINLCEKIIPGATQGGAAEFIDLLSSGNTQLAEIFSGGLAWLDAEMRRRYSAAFVDAKADQQKQLLNLIAYRKNERPEIAPGIRFFDWARRMTVDAYFTSRVGIEAVGFKGNGAVMEFQVPVEALDYALKRSPLGE